jgi:Tfp pilus assembly protein PilF
MVIVDTRHPWLRVPGRLALVVLLGALATGCPAPVPDAPPAGASETTDTGSSAADDGDVSTEGAPTALTPSPFGGGASSPVFGSAPSPAATPREAVDDAIAEAANGDIEEARAALGRLESDPEVGAWATYNLGVLAYRSGDRARALDRFDAALRSEPTLAAALVGIVRIHLAAGDAAAARRAVDQQTARSDGDAGVRAAGLYVLLHERRYEDVIRQGRDLLLDDEGNLDVFYTMAVAYFESGRPALAEYVVDQAMGRDDTRVEFPLLLARIRMSEDNLAGAQSVLQSALSLDPLSAEAHNNLGVVRLRLRNFSRAAESFEAAIGFAPDYAEAWLNLGNARKGMQDYDGAKEAFERALAVRSGYADAIFNLALLYMDAEIDGLGRIERLQEAIRQFDRYAALAGTIPADHPYRTYRPEAETQLATELELRAQREAFGIPEEEPEVDEAPPSFDDAPATAPEEDDDWGAEDASPRGWGSSDSVWDDGTDDGDSGWESDDTPALDESEEGEERDTTDPDDDRDDWDSEGDEWGDPW